ncbi:MAG: hypothetical protein DMD89_37610 [Candidatus Rokuibacteriota bacterium]|nr:MAG: hypothetical protein DMD89_37610 [Candidatus Rokubacteria bacterium]
MERLKVKIAPGLNLIVTASVQGSLLREYLRADLPNPGEVEKDVIDVVRDYLDDCMYMNECEDALSEEEENTPQQSGDTPLIEAH